MNIYVMVDAEGLCGVHLREQMLPGGEHYTSMCHNMAAEINACVAGLKEGGADKIYVQDCHAGGNNAPFDLLTDDAYRYICSPCSPNRMPGIEDCDGIVLLGYHAMAGTPKSVLEHTMSSSHWQNFWINGKKSGELAIDAAIAGSYGVPVIMVSGDDAVCREASDTLGDVVTCEVKKALWTYGAVHLPLRVGHALVKQRSREAAEKLLRGKKTLFTVNLPVVLRVELVERGKLPVSESKPYMTIIDGRTYEVIGDTMEQAFARL